MRLENINVNSACGINIHMTSSLLAHWIWGNLSFFSPFILFMKLQGQPDQQYSIYG